MLHRLLNSDLALGSVECQVLRVRTTILDAWTTIVATCLMTTCFGKGHP